MYDELLCESYYLEVPLLSYCLDNMSGPESYGRICSRKRLIVLVFVLFVFILIMICLIIYIAHHSNCTRDGNEVQGFGQIVNENNTRMLTIGPGFNNPSFQTDPTCQFPFPRSEINVRHSVCALATPGDYRLLTLPENGKTIYVSRICKETDDVRKLRVNLFCNRPPVSDTCKVALCNGNCNEVVFNTIAEHTRIELVYDDSCAKLDTYNEIWKSNHFSQAEKIKTKA